MSKRNEHLQSRIRPAAVTYEQSFLGSLFRWLLSGAHFPELSPTCSTKRKRQSQKLRAYRLLLGRVRELMERFPDENARLMSICAIISEGVRRLTETRGLVAYVSRDRTDGWYVKKGSQPAIAPRLLLAACIAKALYPRKSSYDLVVEELRSNGLHMQRRAVEMQIGRLLANPGKCHVYGAGPTQRDPVVLLRQELFDFKSWKEDQRVDRTKMSTEEFDSQYEDYLGRIHPTSEEMELLRRLLDNFCKTRKPVHAKNGPAATLEGGNK